MSENVDVAVIGMGPGGEEVAGSPAEGRRIPGVAGSAAVVPDWTPVARRIREQATDARVAVGAIPWNLILWAPPGAVVGAFVGTRLQGRVSEKASRMFFSALFAAIGLAFLLAFTVFAHRFA